MTVELSLDSEFKEYVKELDGIQKQLIPEATVKSLNVVAGGIVRELKKQSDKTFEGGATRWTKSGFRVTNRANKKFQAATIAILPMQSKYMQYQIDGGMRTPDGGVPEIQAVHENTTASVLNKYGNITKTRYQSMKSNKDKFFVGVPKGLGQQSLGIWERVGKSKSKPSGARIRMIAKYIKTAKYKKIFPFYETGQRVFFGRNKTAFFRTFEKQMIRLLAKKGYR